MSAQSLLYTKINSLPEQIQQEVLDFIESLLEKYKIPQLTKKQKLQEKKTPRFGSSKGAYKMSDDFDEPLEDFKEYIG